MKDQFGVRIDRKETVIGCNITVKTPFSLVQHQPIDASSPKSHSKITESAGEEVFGKSSKWRDIFPVRLLKIPRWLITGISFPRPGSGMCPAVIGWDLPATRRVLEREIMMDFTFHFAGT
ncbi:hypothetical protein TNCV_4743391 [Trichonephila clavipes]|nr:hypothetical protein TNCV_4743391 [Trichonephila clavipes]